MSYSPAMEWSAKWDLDNFAAFGSKAIDSPKKLQLATDWSVVDDQVMDTRSFNLSGSGGYRGTSGSDGGNGSSAKSSVSASTDSSIKDRTQTPNFRFITFEGSSGKFNNTKPDGADASNTSPSLENSTISLEPLMGLKLGKRTYFENSGAGSNVKATHLSATPTPSTTSQKKTRTSCQGIPIPRCQVEGCNIDLSTAKEYHRKHRVCDTHSKYPKVIVGGVERRFCQQCSRFHSLSEFDEKKRSCRNRLSDHNARRRKPQHETMQFNSTRLSSPFYGGMQQMSFLLNNSPHTLSRTPANSTGDSTCNSRFTITKGYPLKSSGDRGTVEQLLMQGTKLPHVINMHSSPASSLSGSKSSTTEVFCPGPKGSVISSNLDAAPVYGRALSLLSSNSWGSSAPPDHPMRENSTTISHQMMHAIPEAMPLSSTDLWQTGHSSIQPRAQSLAANSNFQEIQRFREPYETDFYSSMLN